MLTFNCCNFDFLLTFVCCITFVSAFWMCFVLVLPTPQLELSNLTIVVRMNCVFIFFQDWGSIHSHNPPPDFWERVGFGIVRIGHSLARLYDLELICGSAKSSVNRPRADDPHHHQRMRKIVKKMQV